MSSLSARMLGAGIVFVGVAFAVNDAVVSLSPVSMLSANILNTA